MQGLRPLRVNSFLWRSELLERPAAKAASILCDYSAA